MFCFFLPCVSWSLYFCTQLTCEEAAVVCRAHGQPARITWPGSPASASWGCCHVGRGKATERGFGQTCYTDCELWNPGLSCSVLASRIWEWSTLLIRKQRFALNWMSYISTEAPYTCNFFLRQLVMRLWPQGHSKKGPMTSLLSCGVLWSCKHCHDFWSPFFPSSLWAYFEQINPCFSIKGSLACDWTFEWGLHHN